MQNEITLIVGQLGVGKSTLANYAFNQYNEAIVITPRPEDFNCEYTSDLQFLVESDKMCFVSDELIENEIAMRIVYELGNRLLIIDEAHLYQDSIHFKDKIMRYSRHKKIDVVLVSHTLFDFARLNRVLVNNIVSFRIQEPYELSYINRINENVKVDKLENFEFVVVQGNTPTWLNKKDLTIKDNILKLKHSSI